LEFLGLLLLIVILLHFTGSVLDRLIMLFFLVVVARESVLGLVLFVLFTRNWGKDYILSTFSAKF
jgi:NADH:ubiquinone oxidoreductase subunit K